GDFTEGEKVKIFPNESFGFMRITVERPLRVRWEVTDDTLAALAVDSKVAKLDDDLRDALSTALEAWRGESLDNAAVASKRVKDAMKALGLKGKPLESAILDALAVRDADAEPVTDAKGNVQ